MPWIIPPPAMPWVPVAGTASRFPVRRVFCVGRNYVDHGIEMGGDPRTEPPFFFTKPADAVVVSDTTVSYPPQTADFHHEGELVVALQSGGADIPVAAALGHVLGYAAGNDLTRRDLQAQAKAQRRPWDMSKGFDASAVVGTIRPGASLDPGAQLMVSVNGQTRQSSTLGMMIWSVPEIIAALSRFVTLAAGDLIMTGTPAGVGPLQRGDRCTVTITGLEPAHITVA